MTIRRKILAGAALLASASALPFAAPALAQDADAAPQQTRDVVTVTARRREESLQDVPMAVTALSGEQLEQIGAQDITFVGQVTPNVTLETSRATNTTLTAFIRGVGQQDPVAGFEQGVGIYLDDVYLNRPQAAVLDIYDVERIEVLRGPQGTLYGRNTIGGAIKYVTRDLADEPELRARVNVGSYNQLDYIFTGSTPLSEGARVGGSIARLTREGFGENLLTGSDNYNKDIWAGRLSAEFDLAPNLRVSVSGDYLEDESNPRHGFRLRPSALTTLPAPTDRYDTTANAAAYSPLDHDNRVEASGGQLNVEWDINDVLSFRSITAMREDLSEGVIDFDSTEQPTFDAWVVYDNEQFSQEFQLQFDTDRVSGVAGLYYLDANALNAFDVLIFNATTSFTLSDVDTETWAMFGEATFDVTDRLSFTLGARYTEDERSTMVTRESFLGTSSPYFGNTGAISLTPVVTVDGEEVVPTFNGARTDDAFTPRVSIDYALTDEINVYASLSQGFKGGLFDPRGNFSTEEIREGVEPETVDSIELGMKGTFFDGFISQNTAVFWADYTNVQIPGSVIIQLPGGGTSFQGTLTNAGAADFFGVEVEGTAYFTDNFTANYAIGYLDGEYTEFLRNGVNIADTAAIQNTPEWTGSFALNYNAPLSLLGRSGSVNFNGQANYRGDTQQFEFAIPLLDQEAFWLYNASVAWTSDDGRLSAALHGRNLADEEYITSGYNFGAIDGSDLAFYGDPRTFTVSLSLRY
ncbi:MAG: TonB-dependent receptor [Oceanicaulis sp.]